MLHGAIAAAYAWVAVTALALALAWSFIGSSMSVAQASRWLGLDVIVPIAAAGFGAGLVRSMVDPGASAYATAASVVGASVLSLICTALVLPRTRSRWRRRSAGTN
jgi:hypothetical protein